MYDLGVSYTFHFCKKNAELSVIFLRNGVLILSGKKNKEATAICFEIRIPKKKNKELLRKVPSKIYGSNFIMKNNKTKFWFVDISDHPHREMGLMWTKNTRLQTSHSTYPKNIYFFKFCQESPNFCAENSGLWKLKISFRKDFTPLCHATAPPSTLLRHNLIMKHEVQPHQ